MIKRWIDSTGQVEQRLGQLNQPLNIDGRGFTRDCDEPLCNRIRQWTAVDEQANFRPIKVDWAVTVRLQCIEVSHKIPWLLTAWWLRHYTPSGRVSLPHIWEWLKAFSWQSPHILYICMTTRQLLRLSTQIEIDARDLSKRIGKLSGEDSTWDETGFCGIKYRKC